MTIASGSAALAADLLKTLGANGYLDLATSTELTISSGAVTNTQNWHTIDTQSDAASDDLDTITPAADVTDGYILLLRANNAARTVVLKHNTGNIYSSNGADISLTDVTQVVMLIWDATLSKWIAVSPVNSSLVVASLAVSGTTTTTGDIQVSGADILVATGDIRTQAGLVGYTAGGSVTQLTSKSTGVTLNQPCGLIQLHNASLDAATVVQFTFTNSYLADGDVIAMNWYGGTAGAYNITAAPNAAGSATIYVRNLTGGALAETVYIQFAVIRARGS